MQKKLHVANKGPDGKKRKKKKGYQGKRGKNEKKIISIWNWSNSWFKLNFINVKVYCYVI